MISYNNFLALWHNKKHYIELALRNRMPLHNRSLQYVLAVNQHGAVGPAAAALGLSQPALSKAIRLLETELGIALFERGRYGATPTEAGERLIAHARLVENESRALTGDLKRLLGADKPRLRIGCGPSEATRLLPAAISEFKRREPGVQLTVLYGLNEALMPMVKAGEVDFALSSVPHNARDAALHHEALYADEAAVIARDGHPLARKRSLKASELQAYPWVLAGRRELERRALDDLFLGAGLKAVEAEIETTSAVLMKTVVMQSDSLTFLPRELIYWEERAGFLTALKVGEAGWKRYVGITSYASARLGLAATGFIEVLRAIAAHRQRALAA